MTTIRADRDFLDKLAYLARRRNTNVADLVRQALDKQFPILNRPSASFFALVDGENHQEVTEANTHPEELAS